MLFDDLKNSVTDCLFEKCKLENVIIDIPQEICEQKFLFKEIVNLETWEKILTKEQRAHLMKFLPVFPENDLLKKQQVVRDLFNGSNFKFGNPVDHFHKKLKDGLFSPDMAKMAEILKKAKHREYMYQQQHYYYKLLQEILVSRKRLLETAEQLPPDQPIKMERIHPKPSLNFIEQRTKRKYLRELQEMREEISELATSSEDENYPEGMPPKLTKRQKRQMMQLEASLSPEFGSVMSTFAPKSHALGYDCSNPSLVRSVSPFELTEECYREMLMNHKRRREANELHPELDVEGITLQDIGARTNIPKRSTTRPATTAEIVPKKKINKDKQDKKRTMVPANTGNLSVTSQSREESDVKEPPLMEQILVQPKIEPSSNSFESSFKDSSTIESDFNASLPIESEASIEPELDFSLSKTSTPTSVSQSTYASFFSLVRNLICECSDAKITLTKLEEKVQAWQESPFSGLNDWYGVSSNWVELVNSALKFLSGQTSAPLPDNFIPLIDHKEKHQIWSWAAEGRDGDDILTSLCQLWCDFRQDEDLLCENIENGPSSPLPPRVVTDWSVRPATDEEKVVYREQERCRYENPHKAFTFAMHQYEAVVGPVKGVYGKDAGVNKAREHSLLVSDRPPFVTILSLVRDAAARLPNGEGTRADICELLKDSQFLAPATDSQIHTVVSGALDRLHYEKDPCVKYDVNRKIWIYLHRNRTEEEYERIHQAHATVAKTKKVVQKSKIKQPKTKTGSRPASSLSVVSNDSLLSADNVNSSSNSNTLPLVVSTGSVVTPQSHKTAISTTPKPTATKPSTPTTPPFFSSISSVTEQPATPIVTNINSTNVPVLNRSNSVPVSSLPASKKDVTESIRTLSSNETIVSSPFIIPTQNHLCSPTAAPSSAIVNTKAVSAATPAQLVNITQVQLVGHGATPSSIPITVPSTKLSNTLTQLALPSPPKTVGAIMAQQAAAAAAKAVTINTQAIGTVKLVSSGITQTQTSATLAGRPLTASMVAHSVSQSAIQGMPTIVIKQESNPQLASSQSAKTAAITSSKPVVARIISPPQVVSVGNLIASTLAATQKQGTGLHGGTTTIKIQGSNIISGKPSHLNVLQTSAAPHSSAGVQGTLPRLAIVSQGNAANLIPVSGTTVTTQPKLVATPAGQIGIVTSQLTSQQGAMSNVAKPTILASSGIKIVSATPNPNVSIAQLSGKTTQTVVVTTKPQTPVSITGTLGAATGTQNLILTGGMQTSTPAVVIASQRTLKPAQTVVTPGGTTPTVVMAAQPGLRPIAATAVTSVNVKALQGVKVIPVTQTNVGVKGKTQPVFARIISPPASLTLRPTSSLNAATAAQQGIGVIHAMAHMPSTGLSQAAAASLNAVRTSTPGNLAQATIIRVQSPQPQ